jgi:hypothetical protein
MVHALERASRQVGRDGAVVLIQPHVRNRPAIAIADGRRRKPVARLANPVFQPLIEAANGAIAEVVADGMLEPAGRIDGRYRVRLDSLAELDRYLHLSPRPPRFPAGGRRRLLEAWRRRKRESRIEVTEFFTVLALRLPGAATVPGTGSSSRP